MSHTTPSREAMPAPPACGRWPTKVPVLAVDVSITNYREATRAIIGAAKCSEKAIVSCHAVHSIVTATSDTALRDEVNAFEMVTPDGQPVRWVMNWFHGAGLPDRVYGPQLMLDVCEAAAEHGLPVYLYGATEVTLERLAERLLDKFPNLKIAGRESPPFRALTTEEDEDSVQRINRSGARILFVGLGCPKQDEFAYTHRLSINAVKVCVGAAFNFHAGDKRIAPAWMQRSGLEWLFRLCQEPRRLWKRYLVTNSAFIWKLLTHHVMVSRRRGHIVGHDSLASKTSISKSPIEGRRN